MLTARVEETDILLGLDLGPTIISANPSAHRQVVARAKAVLRRSCEETLPDLGDRAFFTQGTGGHGPAIRV
jgi:two-component system response regulator BaeR